jgi:hypothetical protein
MKNTMQPKLKNSLIEKYTTQQDKIIFEEAHAPGYKLRTLINASADATLAFAIDFKTGGEVLTKKCVDDQEKVYIGIQLNDMLLPAAVGLAIDKLNSCSASTLNIAGNGLYTMKGKYIQQEIDTITYDFLKQVLTSSNLKNKITLIRSGGQTGFDEAGIKAAVKLDIPALILAPHGWLFRDINGKDIRDEKAFKNRFNTI